ncbi:hypothetical protein BDV18DRAFT_75488 [Aspergillus unguis]
MSSRPTNDLVKPSAFTGGPSTHSEKDLIDRQLKHLREEVLPFYPFLLTVPTDVPFRLGNRAVNDWAVSDDGPFTPEEQQLQYMTFLTHDESDSLLVSVGDWSDTTGSVMADSRSRPQSATSTPSSSSTKKKISLHDYKTKRKNGTSPSHLSQEASGDLSASTLHVPSDNQTSRPIPTNDNHPKLSRTHLSPKPSPQSEPEHVDRKRPPDRDRDSDRHTLQAQDYASAKRRKVSPEPSTAPSKRENPNTNGLPELLSPTLPPTSSAPRLPRLLSPTLPPDLERELAKIGSESLASDSQPDSTANSDITKPKAHAEKSSVRGITNLESTAASSTPNFSGKSPRPVPDKSASRASETSNADARATLKCTSSSQLSSRLSQPSNIKSTQSSLSRPRLVVKLKYGRSNRKRVEGLLKFSGKRKLSLQGSPAPDTIERDSPHTAKPEQPRGSASDQAGKFANSERKSKPPASNQANPSTKDRTKEPRLANADKPQTPTLSHTQLEKARSVSITPAKDLKKSSSRQELSSNDGKGHSQPAPRKAPMDPSLTVATQSPSQSSSVDRSGERRAWKEEYQKYGNLGRELKHAADRHTAKDKVASADEKLAAATAIEAIICFVLAFIAEDQSKTVSRQVGDSSTWLSIIAYWRVVRKNSHPYPPLHSLCLVLGAVSYDAIHALDLERLAATPIPGEHTPVPTPASDGQPVQSEESKKGLKDFHELKSRLLECYKESQRLWFEGSRGLSEDIIAQDFPETWSKRARDYSKQGQKALKPGEYSGDIYIPFGKISTPLEIVRFSCAILKEWCSKEHLDWRSKLSF